MLPGTFLVTGGSNDGVTRLVGDVVHEFNMTTVNEFDQCPSIGIVCLDRLPNKDTIKLYELTRGVFGIDSDGELFTVDNRGERSNNRCEISATNNPNMMKVYMQPPYRMDMSITVRSFQDMSWCYCPMIMNN
ncbi:hypothetical protein DPMN_144765 [Dreissena polymorpha]|uniref:Uncharacterized protein n=1 Tax=Dreissena polymorpha TaxID=45954 RepID=A0A9D4F8L6_DREPO|nr:hypothetical protein DPMN_144765 [Dreissena polymorpha]